MNTHRDGQSGQRHGYMARGRDPGRGRRDGVPGLAVEMGVPGGWLAVGLRWREMNVWRERGRRGGGDRERVGERGRGKMRIYSGEDYDDIVI